MSFRAKTIIGIALIQSVLLLVLVFSGLNYLSESNSLQLQQRASSTVGLFSAATRDAVLATDIATLESIATEMMAIPDVVYVRISGGGFVLAESGDAELLASARTVDQSLDSVTDEIFDVRHELEIDNFSYGTIELGFSTRYVDELLARARFSAFSLAGAEIVLVAIFSFILGTFLTRQLALLKQAAESIASHGPGAQIEVVSKDEIGDVARSFNTMSHSLEQLRSETDENLESIRQLLHKSSRNEAMSNAILDASLDGIICIDSSGKIFECNQPASAIFGWSKQELLGRDISETIIPEKYREAHRAGMKKYLETGEGPVLGQRLELEAVNKDGRIFPIEISISLIDSDSEVRFASYIRDLTVTKALEAEQKLARSRAERASEAKSRFLATMSHEIRSPLNAIIGMNALLLETELDDRQREIARSVNEGGEVLSLLLNDILDFSKIESGQLTLRRDWFDLRAAIQRVIKLHTQQASLKGLQMNAEFSEHLQASYFGDQTRILQILINLLSNAIKFTEAGEIRVMLQPSADGNGVRLEVEDTGIGISLEQREHIFAEFAQVDSQDNRKFGGTGLGLSIAKRLVDLMQGSISVLGDEGQGARFTVEIPLQGRDDAATPAEAAEPALPPDTTFRGFKVLLAEDSATNRKVIEASLAKLELEVESAVNGAEAVRMADANYYDLILMDLAMPEMTGLEATRRIRSGEGRSRQSKIIAITANAFEEDKENCIAAGMDDFISKPIDLAAFRELAGRWLLASRSDSRPTVKTTLVDVETFMQLERDTGEVLPDIFRLFVDECRARMSTMETAYRDSDWNVIGDQAHALKSSSGSFGAIKLQAFAREMEEAAKTGNRASMDELFARLEQVMQQSLASLTELIEGRQHG